MFGKLYWALVSREGVIVKEEYQWHKPVTCAEIDRWWAHWLAGRNANNRSTCRPHSSLKRIQKPTSGGATCQYFTIWFSLFYDVLSPPIPHCSIYSAISSHNFTRLKRDDSWMWYGTIFIDHFVAACKLIAKVSQQRNFTNRSIFS